MHNSWLESLHCRHGIGVSSWCGKTLLLLVLVLLVATLVATGLCGCSASAPAAPAEIENTTTASTIQTKPAETSKTNQTSKTAPATSGKSTTKGSNTPSAREDSSTPTPATAGALQVNGSRLCDSDGDPVQLRGVSTHGLAWYPQYVNQEFFTELREDWNANVVRLALYTAESGGYCTDGNKDELYQLVLDGVKYATEANLYVIVDWHILSDNNPLTHQDEAADFFSSLSAQLGDQDNVIYEICNEPNGGTTWEDITSYAQAIIPLIRANDPDAIIVVGTPTWSQEIDKAAAAPLDFDNVMYTLHFYATTHKDDLRQRLKAAVEDGLPVFVTEFGICDASGNGQIDYDSADAWIELLDSLDISYICWNLSNKNEAAALFKSDCDKTSGFESSDLSEQGLWLWDVLHDKIPDDTGGATVDTDNSNEASVTTGGSSSTGSPKVAPANLAATSDTLSGIDGAFAWTVTLKNSWSSNGTPFYQYDTTITNTGSSETTGWQITIPFAGSFKLSDSWNGQFAISGTNLTIASVDYNAALSPNQSTTDVGFIVCGSPVAS